MVVGGLTVVVFRGDEVTGVVVVLGRVVVRFGLGVVMNGFSGHRSASSATTFFPF